MRLPVIAAFMALLAGCQKPKLPEAAVQTVSAAVVEEIRPDAPQRYSATMAASVEVNLAFKSAGVVEQIYQVKGADGRKRDVEAGDYVEEGTELAVVRRLDYEQRLQQTHEQTGASEAQLAQAEVALRQAELDYTRAANLYRSASIIKQQFEQAETRLDSAKAQVEGARAAVATARNVTSQAELTLSDTSVHAPFSGWITARNVERGSLAGNQTVAFSMVDTHVVKAIFAVPDTSLKSIRLGQRLLVSLDALQRPVGGVVTEISPQADPRTHVFSVEVSIANPKNDVRPGMVGSLTLGAEPVAPRLMVPLSAVVRAPGNPNGFAVFRLQERGGKTYATAQNITPGPTYGNAIEVASGVRNGERIVGIGGELLRDGQEVRVVP